MCTQFAFFLFVLLFVLLFRRSRPFGSCWSEIDICILIRPTVLAVRVIRVQTVPFSCSACHSSLCILRLRSFVRLFLAHQINASRQWSFHVRRVQFAFTIRNLSTIKSAKCEPKANTQKDTKQAANRTLNRSHTIQIRIQTLTTVNYYRRRAIAVSRAFLWPFSFFFFRFILIHFNQTTNFLRALCLFHNFNFLPLPTQFECKSLQHRSTFLFCFSLF